MQLAGVLARAQAALNQEKALLQPLAQLFHEHGYQLYVVGGCVRDALLGTLSNDLDFTTNARPQAIKEILSGFADAIWEPGIAYGTISAEKDERQLEITTFRSDTYDGHSRNPEVLFGDRLEDDLIRRDFRVNAMAIEILPDGSMQFHDPMGGLDDLMASRLDTPATPEQSFHDDPLRMLRAARFAAQLNFEVAERVRVAMAQMSQDIARITAERIRAELDKLMLGQAPWQGIGLIVDTHIADIIFPEIPALQLEQDEHQQHKDVYAHSLKVLRQAIGHEQEPDLVLRWAALLHDIGKPDTRAFNEQGHVSFHQHEVVGAKLARRRMRALKYSKQMISDVSQLIYLHMRFHGFSDSDWTDSAVRRYVADAGELLPRLHKLVRSDCTTRNKKKADRLARAYDRLEERIEALAAAEDLARVRPDLDGNEIMEILGLQPGPEVGQAWTFLKELRLECGPLPREEAITRLQQWWAHTQKEGK
ncbi:MULTISPECIES: CCA tRNA nucleotidyltransferase [unclassified Corynebacterium]|uniref:CCA tRNA nucleotidyltransferase n=1 Tax=Corynebacterium sp. sy017 TaxID=2499527 RepID=UPI001FEF5E52|nr:MULTISPECIES: CCA tRNA nucleotidyltransferase [unclassified Corynebacterium]